MSTETQEVLTAPETQNAAPETVTQTPEPTDQDSTAPEGQEAEAAASDAEKPEKTPEQKELERLRRGLTKAQRVNGRLAYEAQQAREQVQRYVPPQQEAPLDLSQMDANTFRQVVSSEAEKLAAQHLQAAEVKRSTDQTIGAGHKAFGTDAFDEATNAFIEEVGGVKDSGGQMNPVVRAVLKMPDAHAVIKFLGDNLDIAAELPGLDPFDLGLKLAEVKARASRSPAPRPVSKAPTPAKPIGATRGTANLADLPMDEYVMRRKEQGARWAK